VGIVLEAAPALGQVEWFGRGPVETYPDRRRAGSIARWQSSTAAQHVPYGRPQESGGHVDTRWLVLSDGAGLGFRIACDRPAQFSATHFRAADLAAAGHDVELVALPQTIVHVDVAHRASFQLQAGHCPSTSSRPGRTSGRGRSRLGESASILVSPGQRPQPDERPAPQGHQPGRRRLAHRRVRPSPDVLPLIARRARRQQPPPQSGHHGDCGDHGGQVFHYASLEPQPSAPRLERGPSPGGIGPGDPGVLFSQAVVGHR
jgi:hypothetical protein